MLEITSDEIGSWSERHDAAAVLPALVRRLILECARIAAIEMRAHAGVRLAGFDGRVSALEQTAFVPLGPSVWELSVRKDALKKIESDFATRKGEIGPDTTYVAIASRRIGTEKKDAWAAKNRHGLRAVRILDADDLAIWLEQAPATSVWFAAVLGHPRAELSTPSECLKSWCGATTPALPAGLLRAGHARLAAAERLRNAIDRRERLVHVRTTSHREALAFAAAVLAEPEASIDARSLILEGLGGWRWAVRHPRAAGSVLVTTTIVAELGEAPDGAVLVLATDYARDPVGFAIDLGPVPWQRAAELMTDGGFDRARANERAEASGGDLATLRRLCGAPDPEPRLLTPQLVAFALVGAWGSHAKGDAAFVRALGWEPDVIDAACSSAANSGDRAVVSHTDRRSQSYWGWRSRADAWNVAQRSFTARMLMHFERAALDCLSQLDPRFENLDDPPWRATLEGRTLDATTELRHEVSETLVRLRWGFSTNDARAQAIAKRVGPSIVRGVLQRHWRSWASVGPSLRLLAQAAPDEFLAAAESSSRVAEGLRHLFVIDRSWGPSPHTELLWALETLAWSPDHVVRVALLLADLASTDTGTRTSNRPFNSLASIVDSILPQSATTVEQRVSIVDRVDERFPDIGWRLLVDSLREPFGMFMPSARPLPLVPWAPVAEQEPLSIDDYDAQLRCHLRSVLARGASDGAAWASLVRDLSRIDRDVKIELLQVLLERVPTIAAARHELWTATRSALHSRRIAIPVDDAVSVLLAQIYEFLTPVDLVESVSWLFSRHAVTPQASRDWQESQRHLAELRAEAIERTVADSSWKLLERLVGASDLPYHIAETLALRGDGRMILDRAIAATVSDRALWPIVPPLVGALGDFALTRAMVERLVADGRTADAIDVAGHTTPSNELWDFIDVLGNPVRAGYWSRWVLLSSREDPLVNRAVTTLLEHERVANAFHLAGGAAAHLNPDRALDVLRALLGLRDESQIKATIGDQLSGFHLEKVLDRADQAAMRDPNVVASVELTLLPLLEHSTRAMKGLSEMLASDPPMFVRLLCDVYRDERQSNPAELTQAERAARAAKADIALRVFDDWRDVPGADLPGENEREEALYNWCRSVLELAMSEGRGEVARVEVARVLARAWIPSDRAWPCIAARRLLEEDPTELDLVGQLRIAQLNRRGVVKRQLGEGGRQERELARKYTGFAAILEPRWPRAEELLRMIAADYQSDAVREDDQGRATRERYGIDERAPDEKRDADGDD